MYIRPKLIIYQLGAFCVVVRGGTPVTMRVSMCTLYILARVRSSSDLTETVHTVPEWASKYRRFKA